MNEHFYENHPEYPPMWDDEPITEEWIVTEMETTFHGDVLTYGDRMFIMLDLMKLIYERTSTPLSVDTRASVVRRWATSEDDAQMMWEDHVTFTNMWKDQHDT